MRIFFFFNDTATTEIYTLPYTTLFRSGRRPGGCHAPARRHPVPDPGRGRPGPRRPGGGHLRRVPLRRLARAALRSEEHTSELQSRQYLVCRLLLEKKKINNSY